MAASSRQGTLIRNSIIYTVVTVLQKAVSFFLLPVYTRFLSPNDYGITAVVNSLISLLSLFYTLSLGAAYIRFYYDVKDDAEKLRQLLGTCFAAVCASSLVFTGVVLVLHRWILDPFLKGISFVPFMLIGLATILVNPVYDLYQSELQARQAGRAFGLNTALFFGLNVVLTVLFIVVLRMQALGMLLANMVAALVFCAYALWRLVPRLRLRVNRQMLRQVLRYSLPILPHRLSGWMLTLVDRLLINRFLSPSAVGVYNVGFQFGNVISSFTAAVSQAYSPWFIEQVKAGEGGGGAIRRSSLLYVTVTAFVGLTIALLSPEIIRLMTTSQYYDAWKIMPYVTFSQAFTAIYYATSASLTMGKTKYLPITSVIGAAVSITLNLVLIPRFGLTGAAVASVSAMVVMGAATVVIAHRVEDIRFNWPLMYLVMGGAFALSILLIGQGIILKLAVIATAGIATALPFRRLIVARVRARRRTVGAADGQGE
jgi:O-antigen/teichoic acid export membrane protein